MLNVLGLNGLTIWPISNGRINEYYTKGCFPFRWNWRQSDLDSILAQANECFGSEPYVVVGFSDGATMTHLVAQQDPNCIGVIAASGLFYDELEYHRKIPVLLCTTRGDIFHGISKANERALQWYEDRGWKYGKDIQLLELDSTTWHGHEFANTLSVQAIWSSLVFKQKLPIKPEK